MNKLFLATKNKDKIKEMTNILGFLNLELLTPYDLGFNNFEPVEDGKTLKENAIKKAVEWFKMVKMPVIADDTGLFVRALNEYPGVYSARFAGENASYEENRNLLLLKLKGISDRKAYFETVICFFDGSKKILVNGKLYGKITEKGRGQNGFGYDPIFMPDIYNKTLSEITPSQKNAISHRAIALLKLREKLKEYYSCK